MAVKLVYTCERCKLDDVETEATPRVLTFGLNTTPKVLELDDDCYKSIPLAEAEELARKKGRSVSDAELKPRKRDADWPCPVMSCDLGPYTTRSILLNHLNNKHNMTLKAAEGRYGKLNFDATWGGPVDETPTEAPAKKSHTSTRPTEIGEWHCRVPGCKDGPYRHKASLRGHLRDKHDGITITEMTERYGPPNEEPLVDVRQRAKESAASKLSKITDADYEKALEGPGPDDMWTCPHNDKAYDASPQAKRILALHFSKAHGWKAKPKSKSGKPELLGTA